MPRTWRLSARAMPKRAVSRFRRSEGDDDPNSGNTDPGYSGGGTKYGSDDLVLDVNTAKPEKYGKFLDEYRNKVKEFKTDECSEELSIFIEQYFQMLYHGLEEDKD